MATPDVIGSVGLPAADQINPTSYQATRVTAELVGYQPGVGFAGARAIGGTIEARVQSDGSYRFVDMAPNEAGSDAVDDPENSAYRFTVAYPDGKTFSRIFFVTNDAGPLDIDDLWADAPTNSSVFDLWAAALIASGFQAGEQGPPGPAGAGPPGPPGPAIAPEPTLGAGTSADPWQHADGTGGILTARDDARTAGKMAYIPAGVYLVEESIADFEAGDNMWFEPGCILRPSGFSTNENVVDVQGSSGDRVAVRLGGHLHFDRSDMGSTQHRNFFGRYLSGATLPLISADGGEADANTLRLEDSDALSCPGVSSFDASFPGASAVFLLSVDHSSFGPIISERGDEALDLANCFGNGVLAVLGIDGNEVVDIGSSSWNQIGIVHAIRPASSGANFKIDTGLNSSGCVGNRIETLICEEVQSNVAGLSVVNSNEAVPMDDNSVGSYVMASEEDNARGLRIIGHADAPVKRFRIDHVNIRTTAYGITAQNTEDLDIAGGYVETTDDYEALLLSEGSTVWTHVRPKINLTLKSGRSNSDSGAASINRARDFRLDLTVIESASAGVVLYKARRGVIRGDIGHCDRSGVRIRVVDDANYRGELHIRVLAAIHDTDLLDTDTEYAVKVAADSGSPQIRFVTIESDIYDTQGTATTRGISIAGQDYTSIRCRWGTTLLSTITGTAASNDRWEGNVPRSVDQLSEFRLGSDAATSAALRLNAAAGNPRDIGFRSGNLIRWLIRVTGAEGGANAGGDMSFLAFADNESSIGTAFGIRRADRRVLFNGGVRAGSFTTSGRPSASSVEEGTQIFDTDLNKPLFSDGSAWVDATGTPV